MKIRLSTVVVGVLGLISGIAIGYSRVRVSSSEREMKNKMYKYYVTLNNWLEKKQNNINLSSYFQNMGYKSVAIYGMKEVGERLYNELKDTETEVKYVIDQNADSIYADVDIYSWFCLHVPDRRLRLTGRGNHYFIRTVLSCYAEPVR